MALKYKNQFKISLNNLQSDQIRVLSFIHGVSKQEVIRKAIDSFARSENERRLKANPTIKPIVGF
ncbi:MAG: hypothetical protein RJA76_1308 [Bacteroidota bacterium]|jgi:hypothetical protein